MMGDCQAFLIDHGMRNYYSVSVSGYHIAEAGANPVSQLAFTLANGFTLLEYYLSRGMDIDDIAPSLSFFFSSGLDPGPPSWAAWPGASGPSPCGTSTAPRRKTRN